MLKSPPKSIVKTLLRVDLVTLNGANAKACSVVKPSVNLCAPELFRLSVRGFPYATFPTRPGGSHGWKTLKMKKKNIQF